MSRLLNNSLFRLQLAWVIVLAIASLPSLGMTLGDPISDSGPAQVEAMVSGSAPKTGDQALAHASRPVRVTSDSSDPGDGEQALPENPGPIEQKYPHLQEFVAQVSNGQTNVVRGVYVSDLLALPVIQQPENNTVFVSNKRGQVTQFARATRNGVTGLLAHNYLSGDLFYKLSPGQEVIVVYGDSSLRRYRVASIHQFQNLDPSDLTSNLVDLNTGENLTSSEVFQRFYRSKEHRLIFQTCLAAQGRWDWGLTFIVALPLSDNSYRLVW